MISTPIQKLDAWKAAQLALVRIMKALGAEFAADK